MAKLTTEGNNVLIIRLSALGDVAMTIPVVYPLAEANPDVNFYFLSQPFHKQLFLECPRNLHFIEFDTKGKHKGLGGIIRLFKELKAIRFDYVMDLHDVLRSIILRNLFKWFRQTSVSVISKGRLEKSILTRKHNKCLSPLTTTFKRYEETIPEILNTHTSPFRPFFSTVAKESKSKRIGIAPFANYPEKCYPAEKMEEVISRLHEMADVEVYFFGGGEKERGVIEGWTKKYPRTISTVGKQSLAEELKLIHSLDVMLTMDSANMHFASLVGTRVVSIWGATHHYAGFYGWQQDPNDIVQVTLACRPCSVFGNRKCYKKSLECLNKIETSDIISKLLT